MSANVRVKGPNAVPEWLAAELEAIRPSTLAELVGETRKESGPPVRLVDDKARKPRLADG